MTHTFKEIRHQHISTLDITVFEYEHLPTGAMHYHLAADNSENVFLVALRTVPEDSMGVAHILEHTALCGSERFPVRDPFFLMIRRSLNTFMNAMTSSDFTAYPFASQNRKDFDNLLDIYLDAVFFATLDPLDFAQEGHRLEFEEPGNDQSPLVYKGVVYNEMKGASSSPIAVLHRAFQKYLFPTTTYHFDSGGEPSHIPDLSYEDLLAFYRTHYHPSNAIFMTYGNIPAAEHQDNFQNKVLHRFERLPGRIAVKPEKRYFAPIRVEESYALETQGGDLENKTHVVIGWLLGKSTDLEEMLESQLLSDVLLDTSASPLRKALETSNLGTAVSSISGLDESGYEISFACGIEGSEPDRADAIEQLVLDTLTEVARQGVDADRVEAVLHQLELHQREVGGDGYPYGLQLLMGGLSAAVHRGDPVRLLDLDPVLDKLRARVGDTEYIPQLVRKYLLNNPHRLRLTLRPDPELAGRREAAERVKLADIAMNLDAAEKQTIKLLATKLKARQTRKEDLEVLPKVGIDDIEPNMRTPRASVLDLGGNRQSVTFYGQATNGIVYEQIVCPLTEVDEDLLPLLPLYASCLTEIGSGGLDYLETQHRQHRFTGGITSYTTLRGKLDDASQVIAYNVLSSKALASNHEELAALLRDTKYEATFNDSARIAELIHQIRTRREVSITMNGQGLAMTAAASGLSPVVKFNHELSGLVGIQRLKILDDLIRSDDELQNLCSQLQRLHKVMSRAPRQFLLICEEQHKDKSLDSLQRCFDQVENGSEASRFHVGHDVSPGNQLWVTSTQVNFCAKVYPTVSETHADTAALTVLAGVLRNGYLHGHIREQGGAYDAGAGHDAGNGLFRFYSGRDPNLMETLDEFDKAITWCKETRLTFLQVEEAILGVISGLDSPGSPAGEARQAFHNGLYGRDHNHRNKIRTAILGVSVEDLKRVASTYFDPDKAVTAAITNQATADRLAKADFDVFHC